MEITAKNFKKEVLESDEPVFIEFWASWCLPCQMAAPMMDSLEKKYEGKVKIGKINADRNRNLTDDYDVMGLPTFILFKGGREIVREFASKSEEELSSLIDKNI